MAIQYVRYPNITPEDDEWCDTQADAFENMPGYVEEEVADTEDFTSENYKKFPYAFTIVKQDNKRIGYTYILPATKELMDKFVDGKITENQLVKTINDSIKYDNCNAAYLAGSMFTKEHQNKGHAVRATIDTLLNMDRESGAKIKDLYIWPFSDAMNNMIDKARTFAERDGRKLHVYKSNKKL
jgi:hypothetical protein